MSNYCPDGCTWAHEHRFERDGIPWPDRTDRRSQMEMCGAVHPKDPKKVCMWSKGHEKIKDAYGKLWDHSTDIERWKETQQVCGVHNPDYEHACTEPKGHLRIRDEEGTLWHHANREAGAWWLDPDGWDPPQASEKFAEGQWGDLKDRLHKAQHAIELLADTTLNPEEIRRLRAKAQGVRLALSYMEDYR